MAKVLRNKLEQFSLYILQELINLIQNAAKLLRISNGQPTNKAVFIDGGIHAREWISPATVTFFINQFAENFDVESDDVRNIDWKHLKPHAFYALCRNYVTPRDTTDDIYDQEI